MVKNMTLSLLVAAAVGAISIGPVSAMPTTHLAGLGESHLQDVRLVCDRFGRCYNTRSAYSSRPYYARRYYGQPGYYIYREDTTVSLATDITADRVSELVSDRSASGCGNPRTSCSNSTLGPPAQTLALVGCRFLRSGDDR